MKKMHICVSVTTRNRPKMLCNLFSSLAVMMRPEGTRLSFLIVENASTKSLEDIVSDFRPMFRGENIEYVLETDIGISSARNRALTHAMRHGFDLLVFVDDDEYVEADWLVRLLEERDRLDLDIVGSPVRPVPFDRQLNLWQRLVWSGMERNGLKSERRCQRRCDAGESHTIKIATGSWMGRLDFFRETGLRFGVQFGLSGGEDWNLWKQAKDMGAKTGWAPLAIAYETVPSCRLTLAYHFRRNRDHNMTEFAARYRENPKRALRQLPLKLAGRSLKFLAALCFVPFKGGMALVSAAMALGGIVGLVHAGFGKSALHYAKTTGF